MDHLALKTQALGFLRRLGCRALATEVRCPIARFRVDAAGYRDRPPEHRCRVEPQTVVVECKQSRGDFLRDDRDADRLLEARRELDDLRRRIEESRIKIHEPHLRRSGSSLFPELEVWDFSHSRLRGYRRLLTRIRDLDRQLYGETKFFTIARYRLADRLYVMAPRGMIRPHEVPRGWGLVESPDLRVAVEAPRHMTRSEHRVRFLRNIAVSASRAAHRAGAAAGAGRVA